MSTQSNIREGLGLNPAVADAIIQVIENTEDSPQDILKEYIVTNENKKALEDRLELMKPIVDALRGDVKKVFFAGSFRNVKGNYVVNNIGSSNTSAKIEIIDSWLLAGLINQKQYDECVAKKPYSYNTVSFKKV
jgi:hypothetical protein